MPSQDELYITSELPAVKTSAVCFHLGVKQAVLSSPNLRVNKGDELELIVLVLKFSFINAVSKPDQ